MLLHTHIHLHLHHNILSCCYYIIIYMLFLHAHIHHKTTALRGLHQPAPPPRPHPALHRPPRTPVARTVRYIFYIYIHHIHTIDRPTHGPPPIHSIHSSKGGGGGSGGKQQQQQSAAAYSLLDGEGDDRDERARLAFLLTLGNLMTLHGVIEVCMYV